MTNSKCPACVIRVIDPGGPGEWRDPSCTGRPGCVRAPGIREEVAIAMNAAMGYPPPDGIADIVEQDEPHVAAAIEAVRGVERGELMAHLGPRVVVLPKEEHDRYYEIVVQQRAEIARLRAEVERWKERAHLAEGAVAVLNCTIDDLNGEHDALAQRVAEAVPRESVGRVLHAETIGAAIENLHAMNLRPIVDAALKMEGE